MGQTAPDCAQPTACPGKAKLESAGARKFVWCEVANARDKLLDRRGMRLRHFFLLSFAAVAGCSLSHNPDLPLHGDGDGDISGDGDGDADGSGGQSGTGGGATGGQGPEAGGMGGAPGGEAGGGDE